jgi:hypothetical protein
LLSLKLHRADGNILDGRVEKEGYVGASAPVIETVKELFVAEVLLVSALKKS